MNTIQNETFKAEMERDERNYHRVGIVFTVLCALFGFFFFAFLSLLSGHEDWLEVVHKKLINSIFIFLHDFDPLVRFLLQRVHGLHHDILRSILTQSFNVEFKYVLLLPKVNLVCELLMPDALSASCTIANVLHYCSFYKSS